MKTLLALLSATFLFAATAVAHEEHEHAAGGGLFGLPPEYVHVLLNPLPIYGLATGIVILAATLLARSKAARNIALAIIVLTSASAWPVLHYGQSAYKDIRGISDEPGQAWLDEHMERAERFIYVFYATALLGIAALACERKFPKSATPLALATLIAGAASVGVGGWIGKAGGHIRHPEFRGRGAPSTKAAPHDHGAAEHSPGEEQPAHASSGHQHGATPDEPTQKTPLPETLEGVWKAIHEHHGELASSVASKEFKEVQSHAGMVGDLAKRLVEAAPADRKPVVENGVSKINHTLDELKKSAETGSELVMKNNFKEFEKALNELEEQMKEQ